MKKVITKKSKEKIKKVKLPSDMFEVASQAVSSWAVPDFIELLSVEFGREDLNALGHKINEVIAFINKKMI